MFNASSRAGRWWLSAALLGVSAIAAAAPDANASVRTLLGESFEAMQAARSFRVTSVAEQDGEKVTTRNETIWPDRFHVRSGEREFILVPGQSWMKNGGEWMRLPVDMSEMVKGLSPDAMRQSLANLTNGAMVGTEDIKGRPAVVLEYDTSATIMGISAKSHVKVWLDTKTKLPIQQEVSSTALGKQSTSFTEYEFVSDIKIEAPQ